jgi:hypothetical protein
MTIIPNVHQDDDIDDVELHSVTCNCDECVEGLILELQEDRAS